VVVREPRVELGFQELLRLDLRLHGGGKLSARLGEVFVGEQEEVNGVQPVWLQALAGLQGAEPCRLVEVHSKLIEHVTEVAMQPQLKVLPLELWHRDGLDVDELLNQQVSWGLRGRRDGDGDRGGGGGGRGVVVFGRAK